MSTHTQYPNPAVEPVVIIGAGPVGITTAILLAQRGVRSLILERHHDIYPLPRAVTVDDEVFRILQAVGVHEQFASLARQALGLRLLDAQHRTMAEFRRDRVDGHHGFPELSMFDQPDLELVLRQALARLPECELRTGVEVLAVDPSPEGASGPTRITVRQGDEQEPVHLWARMVLGCDGANSITRSAIGGSWEDLHFEERWMVVDVRTRARVRCWEGVDQVCDPARAGTFMRVGEDRYRWEFQLHDDESLTSPETMERLWELLRPWTGSASDEELEVIRQAEYTFRARVADRWRRGGVFLLGDAAHQTPPFVGQGMSAGMRDAYNLAWKLARVLNEGADELLLDSYEAERKPHARQMIRLTVVTGLAMTGGQGRLSRLRQAALNTLCHLPGFTSVAKRSLRPVLARGPLVPRSRFTPRHTLVGAICPQPWVTVGGTRQRLDTVLGDSFAVLSAVAVSPSLQALADSLGARIIHLPRAGVSSGEMVVTDDGTLQRWLWQGRAEAVVLRPDRVVLEVVRAGQAPETTDWAPLLCSGPIPFSTARQAPAPDGVVLPPVSPDSSPRPPSRTLA